MQGFGAFAGPGPGGWVKITWPPSCPHPLPLHAPFIAGRGAWGAGDGDTPVAGNAEEEADPKEDTPGPVRHDKIIFF
jgi:hypothetical protein